MYIQKTTRNGKTSYRAFVRGKHLPKPLTKSFTRKADAVAWATKLAGNPEHASALSQAASLQMTFPDLADKYMAQWTGRDRGRITLVSWWRNYFRNHRIEEITSQHVRAGLLKLESEPARVGVRGKDGNHSTRSTGKPRSGPTIMRYKAALGSIFKFARKEYGFDLNPMRDTPTRPENPGRQRYLSPDEVERLTTACKESEWDKLYLVTIMGLFCGARRGEMLSLRWGDINFTERTAILETTKNGRPRTLTFAPVVIDELNRFRQIGNGLVFASPKDPGKPFNYQKHWIEALRQAGITDFRFHDLRHSCASFLAKQGYTLMQIGAVLGHNNTQTTLRYARLCVDSQREMTDALHESLKGKI